MNDKHDQTNALDRFFDQLVHDAQAEIPADLDHELAFFARELVQALAVPPLDVRQQARIQHAAGLNNHDERKNEAHMKALVANQQTLARPVWNARAYLKFAAVLSAVLIGILILLYVSDQLNNILPDGVYGHQSTPTPPPTALAPGSFAVPITTENAAALSEVAHLGRGQVDQVLWSPGGSTLALVGVRGVWLYAVDNLAQEPTLLEAANINSAQYLANGNLAALIVDPADGEARYVNVNTGEVIMNLPELDGQRPVGLVLSRDGRYLAGSFFDGTVALWDTASGDMVARLFINVNTIAFSLTFSADGTWLAAGPTDFTARLWHAPDSNWASVNGQNPVTLVSALRSEANMPRLAFDAANERLAFAIGDDIEVWDVAQQTVITTLETDDLLQPEGQGGAGQVTGIEFAHDGQRLLAVGQILRVWNLAKGVGTQYPRYHTNISAALSPDSQRIAILDLSGEVYIWSVNPQVARDGFAVHARGIGDIEYSADGRFIATNSALSDVHVLDATTGKFYTTITQPASDSAFLGFKGMALDPAGRSVATAHASGGGTLWDTLTGEPTFGFVVPEDENSDLSTVFLTNEPLPDAITYSADGRLIATASMLGGHLVFVWDSASGEQLHVFHTFGELRLARDMVFSPDGSRLAVAYESESNSELDVAIVWSLIDGNAVILEGHTGPVYTVAFSPDGSQVVTGSADNTARIWDVTNGDLVAVLDHSGPVVSAAFNPAGSLLVTGTLPQTESAPAFGSVTIWDTANDAALVTFPRQGMAVATFSPAGTQIAVGNVDGTISILGIDPDLPPLLEMTSSGLQNTDTPPPAFENTLIMSNYPLVLVEDVDSLAAGTSVRVLDLWYEDDIWWYTVVATDETTQVTVREDQLQHVSAVPTPAPSMNEANTPAAMASTDSVSEPLPAPAVASTDLAQLPLTPLTAENAEQIALINMIGRGEVSTLAWSPDGQLLAASGYVGVWLYDAADYATPPRLLSSDTPLSAVAFAPDDTLYATDFDYRLMRWDLASSTATVVAEGTPNPYNPRLALHPDGTLAAVGGGDGMIRLYALPDGTLQTTLSTNPNTPIDHVVWSADGTRLGATGNDGAGRVWQDPAGTWQAFSTDPTVTVLASMAAQMTPQIAFSPDGSTLVTVGGIGTLFWDAETGEQVGMLDNVTYGGNGIAYSPDGSLLVTASQIMSNPGNSPIVTASADVRLWDVVTNTATTLTVPGDVVFGYLMSAVAFHPDGSQVAALGNSGELAIWDVATGALNAFAPSVGYVFDTDMTRDGSQIVLATTRGDVALWNVAARAVTAVLSPANYLTDPTAISYITTVAISPDAHYVAFGSMTDQVYLWDTVAGTVNPLVSDTFSPEQNDPGSMSQLYALAFSADERLAAGGTNNLINIWDVATGVQVMRLQAPLAAITASQNSTVFSLDWSQDNAILAAGNGDMGDPQTADFSVRLLDLATGDVIASLHGHTDRVIQVQFSPDGSRLLSASYQDLRVWSLPNGGQLANIPARTGAWLGNDVLLGIDVEGAPRIYDAATGDILAQISVIPTEFSLAASENGQLVVTNGRAGVAQIWGVLPVR